MLLGRLNGKSFFERIGVSKDNLHKGAFWTAILEFILLWKSANPRFCNHLTHSTCECALCKTLLENQSGLRKWQSDEEFQGRCHELCILVFSIPPFPPFHPSRSELRRRFTHVDQLSGNGLRKYCVPVVRSLCQRSQDTDPTVRGKIHLRRESRS